ncbi:unnamed protein product [Polarella glacialis]|uniref:Uncharacterized protein n=1 Tax=Polarella glacialis TaxID=89957 RepID=A0A813LYV3_POLGL|nr:unnamed protein product [Polarella glacialis]
MENEIQKSSIDQAQERKGKRDQQARRGKKTNRKHKDKIRQKDQKQQIVEERSELRKKKKKLGLQFKIVRIAIEHRKPGTNQKTEPAPRRGKEKEKRNTTTTKKTARKIDRGNKGTNNKTREQRAQEEQ